jgi:hypothetical protein
MGSFKNMTENSNCKMTVLRAENAVLATMGATATVLSASLHLGPTLTTLAAVFTALSVGAFITCAADCKKSAKVVAQSLQNTEKQKNVHSFDLN